MTVTARAGTPLKDLNLALERLGLSLHNMGDITDQTLAGATSTGPHGTGGAAAGLGAQLAGLELVTGTGEVVRASARENAEVLEMARVGLGALGILTSLTFHVDFYLTFHVPQDTDHRACGRPHWGKVHTRTAADLAPAYDRFDDSLAMRERLDPDRVFTNPYLRRVLGA